jgi:hypothetical protein
VTTDVRDECLALSREAFGRLRRRLDGLDDDEYFWEPAPDSWNVRRRNDGSWWPDDAEPRPYRGPITTIAWRVAHVTDILAQERNATWLGLTPVGPDDLSAEPTASATIERLERANAIWEQYLDAVDDDALWQRAGAVGGSGRGRESGACCARDRRADPSRRRDRVAARLTAASVTGSQSASSPPAMSVQRRDISSGETSSMWVCSVQT